MCSACAPDSVDPETALPEEPPPVTVAEVRREVRRLPPMLREQFESRPFLVKYPADSTLFPTGNGEPLSKHWVSDLVRVHIENAGFHARARNAPGAKLTRSLDDEESFL